jgi:hypothetical protein
MTTTATNQGQPPFPLFCGTRSHSPGSGGREMSPEKGPRLKFGKSDPALIGREIGSRAAPVGGVTRSPHDTTKTTRGEVGVGAQGVPWRLVWWEREGVVNGFSSFGGEELKD